jgi:NitT/TauT family transport system permease protein
VSAARRLLRALLAPLLLLALWEACSRAGLVRPALLPPPSQVAARWLAYALPPAPFQGGGRLAWLLSGELWQDALASLGRVLGGFLIGSLLALPLGLLMGARPLWQQLLGPLVQLLRPIPPIAYVPLAILWFGLGNPPALFLIALGAFFPVLLSTIAGVKSVDALYLRAARSLGAKGAVLFLRVVLPGSLPHVLSGLRVGLGVAFIVVIVAEMIAVNSGLGYRILEAREYFWSDKILAGMLSIGLLGLGLDAAMERVSARLLRWHRGAE